MRLYAGSDGKFYTEHDLGYRVETKTWHPCMWETEEGWELVETADQQLLWLVPIAESDLPAGVEVHSSGARPTIEDTRDS